MRLLGNNKIQQQLTGVECIIASASEFSSQTVIYIIHQSLIFQVQKINSLDILQLWWVANKCESQFLNKSFNKKKILPLRLDALLYFFFSVDFTGILQSIYTNTCSLFY